MKLYLVIDSETTEVLKIFTSEDAAWEYISENHLNASVRKIGVIDYD